MTAARKRDCKIVFVLFLLFFLDIIRPFAYTLSPEFLFLGIIFLFLNYRLSFSLLLAAIFGYLKDAFSSNIFPVNIVEFLSLALLAHYLLARLSLKTAKGSFFFLAVLIHLLANSFFQGEFFIFFSILFAVQSALLFLPADYLLKKWIKILPADYI